MAAKKVVFVIGAGPRIGAATAAAFKAKGYLVAIASRSQVEGLSEAGDLGVRLDLAQPTTVQAAFDAVEKTFGNPPNAVVYNGHQRMVFADDDPLPDVDVAALDAQMAVNITSVVASAKAAVAGFKKLPDDMLKTFLFTGNKFNTVPWVRVMTFSMSKAAVYNMMQSMMMVYSKKGYRFYYADERNADGSVTGLEVDGPAHGQLYAKLAEAPQQETWYHTFVKGPEGGYVDFSKKV